MRVLLDTNAYVALRKGHEQTAREVRAAPGLIISTVVAGELLFGFQNGARPSENLSLWEEFLDSPDVQVEEVTLKTAVHFASISTSLRRQGTPIPTNDIWIAAHSLEFGAKLLSFDAHFAGVANLEWVHLQTTPLA